METQYDSHMYSRQSAKQQQKLIVDQNYSNIICFHCLSTLQSLANTYRGEHSELYDNKMFKHYDTFDYSSKKRRELKIQLKTHLLIFKTSLQLFRNQHQGQEWMLPQNFDAQQVLHFANQQKNVFFQNKDDEAFYMTQDLISILSGCNNNLSYEQMNFGPELSESQAAYHKKNFISCAFKAQQHMKIQGQKVENMENRAQLNAIINHANQFHQCLPNQHQRSKNLEECYLTFDLKQQQLYIQITNTKITDEVVYQAPYFKFQSLSKAEEKIDQQKKQGYCFKAGIDKKNKKAYKLGPVYKRIRYFWFFRKSQPMENN